MSFYSKSNLMKVANARGYMSTRALADALVKYFGVSSKTIQKKINYGNLSMEECEVIGSHLEMSMREYYESFMSGLFTLDRNGHYVCHVPEPYKHLHKIITAIDGKETRINAAKRMSPIKKKTAQEILEQLNEY